MNILQVLEATGAGTARHVRSLCTALVAQGHQLTIAYSPYRADEAFKQFIFEFKGEIRFVSLPLRRGVSPISDMKGIAYLMRLIKAERSFDIVHGHSSKGGAVGRIAGRCFGVPSVYTPNGLIMTSPEISRAEAVVYTLIEGVLGYGATSRIIAVSSEEYEFIRKHRLVPESRVAIVENGIEDDFFDFFTKEDKHKEVSRKPLTFGTVIRFTPQKAPANLLEAFVRLVEMAPQVSMQLVIAGDGELFPEIKRRVAATGLGKKIQLLGWVNDSKKVLRDLDVFVLPSHYEGLSYALLEAMAAKLPIVSTNVFGTKDTVAQVQSNIVVPVGDVEALARGMKQILVSDRGGSVRRLLQSIGQANHDYVRARFTANEMSRRTLEIYQALRSPA